MQQDVRSSSRPTRGAELAAVKRLGAAGYRALGPMTRQAVVGPGTLRCLPARPLDRRIAGRRVAGSCRDNDLAGLCQASHSRRVAGRLANHLSCRIDHNKPRRNPGTNG